MIQEKQKLSGTLNNKQSLSGSLSNSVIYVDPITQEKTVIPTAEQQIVTPDEEYTGLSKVTVEAIQDDNLIPENIKNGVDILGVTGNFIGSKYAPRFISFSKYNGTELDEELANLDTSNLTSTYGMFSGCEYLTNLNLSNFNTSHVKTMDYMFNSCPRLVDLDLSNFITNNVIGMAHMCSYCTSLRSLSNLNTSNLQNITSIFYGCQSLVDLDLSNFDTSKVYNFSYAFYNCKKLIVIPKLNANSATNINYFVYGCSSLTDFGGLENLGQAYSKTTSANNSNYKLDLSTCTSLTEQSLINVLNNLYDIATKGCKVQSVILGSTNLAKLTSEEGQQALAQAQQFGWNVS